jgi:hypothetical protein
MLGLLIVSISYLLQHVERILTRDIKVVKGIPENCEIIVDKNRGNILR